VLILPRPEFVEQQSTVLRCGSEGLQMRGGCCVAGETATPHHSSGDSAVLMVRGLHRFLLGTSGFSQALALNQETGIFLAEFSQACVRISFEAVFSPISVSWPARSVSV